MFVFSKLHEIFFYDTPSGVEILNFTLKTLYTILNTDVCVCKTFIPADCCKRIKTKYEHRVRDFPRVLLYRRAGFKRGFRRFPQNNNAVE